MSLYLRLATPKDSRPLLAWRNHPAVRQNAINTGPIAPDAHEDWLASTLTDPRALLLMAENAGKLVGTLRGNKEDDGRCFLSWTIAPAEQGQGLGRQMLTGFCAQVTAHLFARIKSGNHQSIKIAASAGFLPMENTQTVEIWQRPAILSLKANQQATSCAFRESEKTRILAFYAATPANPAQPKH